MSNFESEVKQFLDPVVGPLGLHLDGVVVGAAGTMHSRSGEAVWTDESSLAFVVGRSEADQWSWFICDSPTKVIDKTCALAQDLLIVLGLADRDSGDWESLSVADIAEMMHEYARRIIDIRRSMGGRFSEMVSRARALTGRRRHKRRL